MIGYFDKLIVWGISHAPDNTVCRIMKAYHHHPKIQDRIRYHVKPFRNTSPIPNRFEIGEGNLCTGNSPQERKFSFLTETAAAYDELPLLMMNCCRDLLYTEMSLQFIRKIKLCREAFFSITPGMMMQMRPFFTLWFGNLSRPGLSKWVAGLVRYYFITPLNVIPGKLLPVV